MDAINRLTVAEAERNLSQLIDRIQADGNSIELSRGDRVVAVLSPSVPRSPLQVHELNEFLRQLPRLDDDAEAFAADVAMIRRELPTEANPWD